MPRVASSSINASSNVNAFPFIQRASGLNVPPAEVGGRLARWTLDLRNDSEEVAETVIGPPGDFPLIPATRQGRPYTHAWMLTHEPRDAGSARAGRARGCDVQPAPAARLHRQAAAGAGAAARPLFQRARARSRRGLATRGLAHHGRGPADRARGFQPRGVDTRCRQCGRRPRRPRRHSASTAPAGARLVGRAQPTLASAA